jgi:hypothetical protein
MKENRRKVLAKSIDINKQKRTVAKAAIGAAKNPYSWILT